MIARMWVDGRLMDDEKLLFLSYGSAEIYIPFFYIAKVMKINYELIYNLVSLSIFFSILIFINIIFPPKDKKNLYFVIPLFLLFGVACLVKGSIHWLIVSVIFLWIISTPNMNFLHCLILGISYILSPVIIVASVILSFIFFINGDRKRSLYLILSIFFALPKLVLVSKITISEVERSLDIANYIGKKFIDWSTLSFSPPVLSVFLRPIFVDYFKNNLELGIIIYTIAFRAIFTKDKKALVTFVLFYVFAFLSLFLFSLWIEGINIPDYIISIISFIFASNPFRYAPVFIIYLILNSDEIRYNKIFGLVIIVLLIFVSISNLIRGYGELPDKIPQDVKSVIHFLQNSDSENILIEGDIHFLKGGRIYHPLYNSHIISYIVAEVDKKNFYGGIIPWKLQNYNFFSGKFNSKPIEMSDILEFIEINRIDTVLCWTHECERFFAPNSSNIWKIGKFSILEIK